MLRLMTGADRDTLADGGLARLHARLRAEAVPCLELAGAFIAAIGVDAAAPLARSLTAVATDADRSGLANAFHNPAHSREVAVNWWLLARLHGSATPVLSPDAIVLGLIAAFGHDLHHDGRGNGVGAEYVPFRLESVAATAVAERMRGEGVSREARDAVSATILCTDVRSGYPHLSGAADSDPRFAPLADKAVLLSARMLRDADLLPSAGTSIAAYRARTAELEQELGLPAGGLSGEAAAGFFDDIVERRFLSPPAQVFAENLRTIATEATAR